MNHIKILLKGLVIMIPIFLVVGVIEYVAIHAPVLFAVAAVLTLTYLFGLLMN